MQGEISQCLTPRIYYAAPEILLQEVQDQREVPNRQRTQKGLQIHI